MVNVGHSDNPLRVAIIGSGPAGFYTVNHLLRDPALQVEIDMFERLPAPFGLVRYGVAPDHPKDKSVAATYDKLARAANYRFYGNMEYGRDLTLQDLKRHYHQVVFATGASEDRHLAIPGEALRGCHSATEFVAWYNGHPDFTHRQFDLEQENVVVVGMGNVALDVARMLCRTGAELARTDIADYALDALSRSKVRQVFLLGRRGPAQAAFTPAEIRELGELAGADVRVSPQEAALDDASAQALTASPDKNIDKNIACIDRYSRSALTGRDRVVTLRFFVSPTQLVGHADRLSAVKLVKNEAYLSESGRVLVRTSRKEETLPAGLLFRAVGYRGCAPPEIPFDEKQGTVENQRGRVTTAAGAPLNGLYVAGWIKRGATGVIGTNKTCARETVACMLEDLAANKHLRPDNPAPEAVERLVSTRNQNAISYHDWLVIDAAEQHRGKASDRPRIKFTSIEGMLAVLRDTQKEGHR